MTQSPRDHMKAFIHDAATSYFFKNEAERKFLEWCERACERCFKEGARLGFKAARDNSGDTRFADGLGKKRYATADDFVKELE